MQACKYTMYIVVQCNSDAQNKAIIDHRTSGVIPNARSACTCKDRYSTKSDRVAVPDS